MPLNYGKVEVGVPKINMLDLKTLREAKVEEIKAAARCQVCGANDPTRLRLLKFQPMLRPANIRPTTRMTWPRILKIVMDATVLCHDCNSKLEMGQLAPDRVKLQPLREVLTAEQLTELDAVEDFDWQRDKDKPDSRWKYGQS